jgi:hypothetical protein
LIFLPNKASEEWAGASILGEREVASPPLNSDPLRTMIR